MSCDGHASHAYERPVDPDCEWCGHPESEHPDQFWEDDRGRHVEIADDAGDLSFPEAETAPLGLVE